MKINLKILAQQQNFQVVPALQEEMAYATLERFQGLQPGNST